MCENSEGGFVSIAIKFYYRPWFFSGVLGSNIAKTVQTKFDATTLHDSPKLAAQSRMVDDGTGQKQVFRVENFKLVEVPENRWGYFYGGDCYVVLYAYSTNRDNYIIYYWLVCTIILPPFRPKWTIVVFRKSSFSLYISKSTKRIAVKFCK